jgi:hypothetical protein
VSGSPDTCRWPGPGAVVEPLIEAVALAGGHDGTPELVVRLRYENGGTANVIVNNEAALRLMARCGVDRLEGLVGRSWRELRGALLEMDHV